MAQAQALGEGYALGGNPASIANRVSYFLDLHGPRIVIEIGAVLLALGMALATTLRPRRCRPVPTGRARSTGRCRPTARCAASRS